VAEGVLIVSIDGPGNERSPGGSLSQWDKRTRDSLHQKIPQLEAMGFIPKNRKAMQRNWSEE